MDNIYCEWLDLKRAVQVYPVSRRSFWHWISAGRLPVYKPFGRKILLKRSDIDRLLEGTRDLSLDTIVSDVMDELAARK